MSETEPQPEPEPIPDPPEEWPQTGHELPTGEPPEGVRSSNKPQPELRTPNFVPPDPVPIMQHEPIPLDEPVVQREREINPNTGLPFTDEEEEERRRLNPNLPSRY